MIGADHRALRGSPHGQHPRLLSDLRHIEAHGQVSTVELLEVEPACFERIVSCDGITSDPSAEYGDQYVMEVRTRFAPGYDHIDGREDLYGASLYTGLLQQFPNRGICDGLAVINLAAWEAP